MTVQANTVFRLSMPPPADKKKKTKTSGVSWHHYGLHLNESVPSSEKQINKIINACISLSACWKLFFRDATPSIRFGGFFQGQWLKSPATSNCPQLCKCIPCLRLPRVGQQWKCKHTCDNPLLSPSILEGAPHQRISSLTWSSITHNFIIMAHHVGHFNTLADSHCVSIFQSICLESYQCIFSPPSSASGYVLNQSPLHRYLEPDRCMRGWSIFHPENAWLCLEYFTMPISIYMPLKLVSISYVCLAF